MAGYGRFILSVDSRNLLCVRNNLLNFYHNVSKTASATKNSFALRPKKPETAFLLYIRTIRPKLLQENPTLKSTQIVKKASEEWARLEPTQKEYFKNQYICNYETYVQRLREFEDSLTEEERQILQRQAKEYQQSSEQSDLRRKKETFGKPKKPLNAFLLYLHLQRAKKDANVSTQEWIRAKTSDWKTMSDAEKERYVSESTASMVKYRKDIEQWERNMISLGHSEIVRRKTLLKYRD